jgi:hypothetical protein
MKILEDMFDELGRETVSSLRQIAAAEYGLEMGELVHMDKIEILDAMLSIEQANSLR